MTQFHLTQIHLGSYMVLLYTVGVDIAGKDHVYAVSGMLALSGGLGVLAMGPVSGKQMVQYILIMKSTM